MRSHTCIRQELACCTGRHENREAVHIYSGACPGTHENTEEKAEKTVIGFEFQKKLGTDNKKVSFGRSVGVACML